MTTKRRRCYGSDRAHESARTGCGAARRGRPWRFWDAAVGVLAVLVTGLTGGCGVVGDGAKPTAEAKAPADPAGVLRQDVDRLRTDLSGLRTLVETAQRTGMERVDRAASETRTEWVQKALEASARHDLQRQVEVLDAQARRIDLLEKRAAEQGQVLRRVELTLAGLESQLAQGPREPTRGTGAPGPGGVVGAAVGGGARARADRGACLARARAGEPVVQCRGGR